MNKIGIKNLLKFLLIVLFIWAFSVGFGVAEETAGNEPLNNSLTGIYNFLVVYPYYIVLFITGLNMFLALYRIRSLSIIAPLISIVLLIFLCNLNPIVDILGPSIIVALNILILIYIKVNSKIKQS
mgnify:CR=1 FL=1